MKKQFLNRLFIGLIRGYQKALSPFLASRCRFYPTCSDYGRQSFHKHFFLKAFYFTLKRILRCHPLSSGGVDEVPGEITRG